MNTGALTQSTSLDMTGDLDVSMIGSNMQLQALENASGYIKARKRTLEVISKKLKRRNTGSGNGGKIRARTPANSSGDTKSSMTCKFTSTHT